MPSLEFSSVFGAFIHERSRSDPLKLWPTCGALIAGQAIDDVGLLGMGVNAAAVVWMPCMREGWNSDVCGDLSKMEHGLERSGDHSLANYTGERSSSHTLLVGPFHFLQK